MAKIVCEECGTEFKYEVAKDFECCPVCGASMMDEGDNSSDHDTPAEKEEKTGWITWYYYGFKDKKGRKTDTTCLDDKPIDLEEHGDTFFLIQEFKAPPRDSSGSSEKAKEILRTYVPDAFVYPEKKEPVVRCPRCASGDFQLVPRKFSILTGFATNKFDRMCVMCKKRF